MQYFSNSESETISLAEKFAETLHSGDIVLLDGDLGAGKTIFAKGIVNKFSNKKINAISPTFVTMNVYNTEPKIYHFDLYRVSSEEELYAIGAEEFIFSDGISLVEWPSRAGEFFPSSAIKVYITKIDENKRKIDIER